MSLLESKQLLGNLVKHGYEPSQFSDNLSIIVSYASVSVCVLFIASF